MKKTFIAVVALAFSSVMMFGQQPGVDTLGGHLLNGRGCAGCHVPHNGARGNGLASNDSASGDVALWGGADLGKLAGATLHFGDKGENGVDTLLPTDYSADSHLDGVANPDPRVGGLLMCLSCHDGNYATGAMMKNQVYETLPANVYGTNPIPTLLGGTGGNNGNAVAGDYSNDHPVGENAIISCTGSSNWDCTINNGVISMTGSNSSQFVKNYGWTVAPAVYNGNPIVICTTCHDQHIQTVYNGTINQTPGFYVTYFGVKGLYNPGNPTGNSTAQFCRQCHGHHANEMNGVYNVPTT